MDLGIKYRNMTFEDTYKEARAHKQEPPPPSIMELQLETTDRKC